MWPLEWVRAWCGQVEKTVTTSVLKGAVASADGQGVLQALDALLVYVVVSAALLSQLVLSQWPANFFGFCILSALLSVGVLAVVALLVAPQLAARLPPLVCVALVVAAAWQAVLGALFMLLPFAAHRALFIAVNTLLVALVAGLASRGVAKAYVGDLLCGGGAAAPAADSPPRSPAGRGAARERDDDDDEYASTAE
jgi:hypothetical protein